MKRNMQDARELAKAKLQTSNIELKKRYVQTLTPLNRSPGDKIMMQEKTSKGKLAPKLLGP